MYREVAHPIIEAIIAWYCSVLTKSIVLYISINCEFSMSRDLSNFMVRAIPINRRSPIIFGDTYSSTIMEWGLRREVPAPAVTTHAKPHAQQQLARDL